MYLYNYCAIKYGRILDFNRLFNNYIGRIVIESKLLLLRFEAKALVKTTQYKNMYECILHTKLINGYNLYVDLEIISLNSEQRDECIDFTMLCVFFLCLCTLERVEIKLQFQTLGMVSYSKMNLIGTLGRSFFEFPNSFQKRREKPKIN
ncbi:Uncharacterized protein FWK35_00004253 [Aphis craccivora]|uniref:Uncharacterized protein n=1 Tax=Aphis craccivora TaxID=307492 RepID=A0A6G0ZNX9_APHCR|nr:Uncharacterized protein FWK35_00004253 [Aphis craccivora]